MRSLLFAAAISLAGCSASVEAEPRCLSNPDLSVMEVFDYSDFGPDVMATELLGPSWYQWLSYGGGDPDREFDVKAVVHAVGAEPVARSRYAVSEDEARDYRYVDYPRAVDFLEDKKAEIAEALREGAPFQDIADALDDTHSRILKTVCPEL